uniref:XRN2-binding (XTBD) domain-containing protein n=1 Tax=Cacopsylla melanoneura TaxID=428564 RepID=A0A8D9AQP0_9HEMI
MSFDTTWDTDKYKSKFESSEHWALRKVFLDKYKTQYPEETLVCYAQVFYNMEFMGCKYPKKTMDIVNELSADIAAEHRDAMEGRLKRTFIGAPDTANNKVTRK